jgi:hypothetical protein
MFTIKGDGLVQGKVDPKLMQLLNSRLTDLNTQYAREAPRAYEDARRCVWNGISSDGLKHDNASTGERAKPFDGAPDVRVRTADKIINELNLMFLLAAMRAQVYIIGPGNGVKRAQKLMALADWLKTSLWGRRYARAILELGNYVFGDTPAVGLMMVPWRETKAIRIQEITTEEAADIFATGFAMQYMSADPYAIDADIQDAAARAKDEFLAVLATKDPIQIRVLADRMAEMLPYMRRSRARRVLADLSRLGKAKFPRPHLTYQGPELEPLRFGEDFLIDSYARDFHGQNDVYFGVWLTESQARELALEEGWSQSFQEKLFGETRETGAEGNNLRGKAALKYGGDEAPDSHKDQFQVVRALVRLANEDGVVGRYWITFHPEIDEPATGLNSSDYPTDGWNGVFFEREVLGKCILDSRGVTELVVGDQALIKKLYDGFGANAIINNVPPVITHGRKDKGQLFMAPLFEIELRTAQGRAEFMKGPQAPAGTPEMIARLQTGIDEQFGRPSAQVPDLLTTAIRQGTMAWMLVQLAEVMRMAIMQCQEWMPDETLQMVVGKDGASVIREAKEIQGPFTLSFRFDPDDMNMEILAQKAKLLKDILRPLDQNSIISWDETVAHLVGAIFPQLEFIKSGDLAKGDEITDEQEQFVRMMAGIEDKRPADGSISYATRAKWLDEHLQAHPELAERLDDKTKLRLLDRLEFLRAQERQFGLNAQIGREGAERKEESGAPAAAPEEQQ